MTWLNKLLASVKSAQTPGPQPVPTVHEMASGIRPVTAVYRSPVLMARGKWVKHEQGVGIIAAINTEGICEVHLTDQQGFTVRAVNSHISNLRVAKLREIPTPRRPTVNHGASLGYL